MIADQQQNAARMQSLALEAAKMQLQYREWMTPGEAEVLREIQIMLQEIADYLSHVDPTGYLHRLQENMQFELAVIRDGVAARRKQQALETAN